MTFPEPLKKLVLYAVLTEKCPYCGTLLSFRGGFCPSCKNNIPVIEKKRCKYCGAEKERCNCRHRRMKYDGITAPFYYEGPVKTAIKRFKFNGKDFLSEFLGGQMAFSAVQDFSNISFDFITYVPFSEQQKRARPYNQSELLAEVLAKKLNLRPRRRPCEAL